MARRRARAGVVGDTAEAVSEAVIRAVHDAPDSLLVRFEGEAVYGSARRLALHIAWELACDGYGEKTKKVGSKGLFGAISDGLLRSGPHILAILPEVKEADGRILDGVGHHAGDNIATVMRRQGVKLAEVGWNVKRPAWARPARSAVSADAPAAKRNSA